METVWFISVFAWTIMTQIHIAMTFKRVITNIISAVLVLSAAAIGTANFF